MNDSLCQIEKCWKYSEKSGRTLVIDTLHSGGFGLPFGGFFIKREKEERVLLSASPVLMEYLDTLETFPSSLARRLNGYALDYEPGIRNFVERVTRQQISFDFEAEYAEALLVHDQCGGGVSSVSCLARLVLAEEFKRDVYSRLEPLAGIDYAAIAIRNTDYQTDYKSAFRALHEKVAGQNLLVCSDDYNVIEYAKSYLTGLNVISLPGFQKTDGRGVARQSLRSSSDVKYRFVVKSMSDLIGLACARKLYVTRLRSNSGLEYSGFVRLSALLHKDRSAIYKLTNSHH